MPKILLVFGTRPEAVKMCPLVAELKTRKEAQTWVCVTGQHRQMLDQVLRVFRIAPDYDLSVMKNSQTLFDVTAGVLSGIHPVLQQVHPDVLVVHGDTTTTFAAALAGFYCQIPVAHVEAGLRTYDLSSPYPEEFNRQAVGMLAAFHFAPTETARNHLIQEGRDPQRIYVTGNTAIDALKTTVLSRYRHPYLDWAEGSRLLLVTAHRRENLGTPMRHMFRAIRRVIGKYQDCKVLYPVHMNPVVRNIAAEELCDCDRIRLIEPLEVLDFHNFLARCYLVLTDSGGIQEEAPALGKPVLVMRDTTERPEGVRSGALRLVGTDEERIYQAVCSLLDHEEEYRKMSHAVNPYGDGFACKRIADVLCQKDLF